MDRINNWYQNNVNNMNYNNNNINNNINYNNNYNQNNYNYIKNCNNTLFRIVLLFYDGEHIQELFKEMAIDKYFFQNLNRELNYYIVQSIDLSQKYELCWVLVKNPEIGAEFNKIKKLSIVKNKKIKIIINQKAEKNPGQ